MLQNRWFNTESLTPGSSYGSETDSYTSPFATATIIEINAILIDNIWPKWRFLYR